MADAHDGATWAILSRLIAFDTTSRNSNLPLIDWAAERLEAAGGRLRLTYDGDRSKANLLASFGPDVPGGVVLSGHTDVVPVDGQVWSSDPFVLTERDGRLYGRGASDMKGFIAACLSAVSRWSIPDLRRPVHLALSYDEEVGCVGAPSLIADMMAHVPRPALAVVGEPTDMTLGVRHAGVRGVATRFKGEAAHASDPSKGVNAIGEAARFIRRLDAIAAEAREAGRGATINVGRIVGGAAVNIVAERCEVVWEHRALNESGDAFVGDLVADYLARADNEGLSVTSEPLLLVPPFESRFDEAMIHLLEGCGACARRTVLPFGSEAGLFERAGVPTMVCGPGSIDQAHRPDEWIAAAALTEADRFIDGLGAWARSTAP